MLSYCSVDDILSVAAIYKKDVIAAPVSGDAEVLTQYNPNTRTIARQEVEDIALEASEMVRSMLQPHYSPAVIDSYDPLFPPIVNFMTKTLGARLMYERYPALEPEQVATEKAQLDDAMKSYGQMICGRTLRDADGVPVPTTSGAGPALTAPGGNFAALDALKVFPVSANALGSGGWGYGSRLHP